MTLEDMEEIVFGCCGAVAWFPAAFLRQKRENKERFYCPNGHPRAYHTSTTDQLRGELDATKKALADLKAGKCPYCWKTVKDLSFHIERWHP